MKHNRYQHIEIVLDDNWEEKLPEVWKLTQKRVRIRDKVTTGKAVRHVMRSISKARDCVVVQIAGIIEIWRKRTDAIAFYRSLVVTDRMKDTVTRILSGLMAGDRLV